jgi:putative toxin-antitoxin system antitoxin component (TIGR02293 family)
MEVQSEHISPTKLYGLPRVLAVAIDTFGSSHKAWSWLRRPNMVLEGERPLDLLDSEEGILAVETVLGRIEWGIYS